MKDRLNQAQKLLSTAEQRINKEYREDKLGETAYRSSLIRVQTSLRVVEWVGDHSLTLRNLAEILSLPKVLDDLFD